ncbi:NADH dehydrogenase [ubiquinone] iron-sulfur protein 6, mitochondrial [Venturia canescens]|uniref:NADH dehydrogenase [ubiquinone] iron-sulfur protein 6, mitochondrial n=1 Tax=Venturia canescens TaxID=32260 RepID=UPI001C9BCA68|nr:NADH dehydrogenase [ubiquinone] iron-sulfur protein 6, mitochondrial [Venturia canescens]
MASRKVCCLLGNSSKLCPKPLTTLSTTVRGKTFWETGQKVTHTGQTYDPNDRRLARFTDRQKEVNPNWAINLIAQVPPKPTKDRIVACDGGGGPLGHPKVYINLDKPGNHSCGYCGLRFHKEDHHH